MANAYPAGVNSDSYRALTSATEVPLKTALPASAFITKANKSVIVFESSKIFCFIISVEKNELIIKQ